MKIRFVTGTDMVSWLIRMGERDGWATHVEAVLPDGGLLGAHYDGGVMIRNPGYDCDCIKRELVVELKVPEPVEKRFYDFLYSQLGAPYDWRAVFGLGLGRNWRDPTKWFCSELIARAEEVAGYFPPLSAIDNHISPRDLLLMHSCKQWLKGA